MTRDPSVPSNEFNPFTPKGLPIDEKNRLALDREKSIGSLVGTDGSERVNVVFFC